GRHPEAWVEARVPSRHDGCSGRWVMRGRWNRRAALFGRAAVAAVILSTIAPAPASADVWCWLFGTGCGGGSTTNQPAERTSTAPEVDPSAIPSVIALLAGGAAVFSDRFRRQ